MDAMTRLLIFHYVYAFLTLYIYTQCFHHFMQWFCYYDDNNIYSGNQHHKKCFSDGSCKNYVHAVVVSLLYAVLSPLIYVVFSSLYMVLSSLCAFTIYMCKFHYVHCADFIMCKQHMQFTCKLPQDHFPK